jgi:hypothetical protein
MVSLRLPPGGVPQRYRRRPISVSGSGASGAEVGLLFREIIASALIESWSRPLGPLSRRWVLQ